MITLRLDGPLTIDTTGAGDLLLTAAQGEPVALHDANGAVAAALHALREPLTLPGLAARLSMPAEPAAALARRLLLTGLVCLGCADGRGDLATARVRARHAQLRFGVRPAAHEPVQLSPYALLRRSGDHAVVESARDGTVVRLRRPALASAVAALCAPTTPAAVEKVTPGGAELVRLLAAVGMVSAPEPEPAQPPHAVWAHSRGRNGLADARLAANLDAAPAEPPAGTELALAVPDLAALRRADPPLAQVMEARRSVRRFAGRAPTLAQLGELLYRVMRVRESLPADPAAGRLYAHVLKPVPSAGAMHELECYVAVRSCDGLAPGIYRYVAQRHALSVVSRETVPLIRMVNAGYLAMNRESVPPLLLSLAARFGRPTRKYGDLAYSLILRDAGVVLQSIYLSATAMGLGACAIGSGEAADFADATGLDPLDVSAVAEIAIGCPSDQDG